MLSRLRGHRQSFQSLERQRVLGVFSFFLWKTKAVPVFISTAVLIYLGGWIITFWPFLSSVFKRWSQNGIFSACGNEAICHWHNPDWICTDAENNSNHLLHKSDVLVHKKKKKPNLCRPLVKSKILNPYKPWSNKGLNLAFPKLLLRGWWAAWLSWSWVLS